MSYRNSGHSRPWLGVICTALRRMRDGLRALCRRHGTGRLVARPECVTHVRAQRSLALVQGVYFFTTGVWPLFHLRSFMAVTGPKTDGWLVKTVGVLVAVIGATLMTAARRPGLATMAAGGLGAIDVIYATRGRIAKIYLCDAVVEGALVAAWLHLAGTRLARFEALGDLT